MTVFNVFERPGQGPDTAVLVPEGFSSRAFLFSFLWALWHRMWIVAAILVALLAALALAVSYLGLPPLAASGLDLGIALIFGHEANNLRCLGLRWAGYDEASVIVADSLEAAELEHAFAHVSPQQPRPFAPPPPRPMQAPADTLGLFGNV